MTDREHIEAWLLILQDLRNRLAAETGDFAEGVQAAMILEHLGRPVPRRMVKRMDRWMIQMRMALQEPVNLERTA